MRSLFKLSLLALLAMLVAGTAMAQAQVKWSGNIGAGFGIVSYGEVEGTTDAYSEYVTSIEANIRATVEAGPVTAVARFRPRGNQQESGVAQGAAGKQTLSGAGATALSDFYTEIWYKPTDTFTIGFGRFQGQAWSQPMSGTYLINHPLGAPEYFMNWTGIDGIDFEFNAGVVQVGVAIASECRPACSGGSQSGSTMVPHLTGKFGDIGIRAQLPSTSAKTPDDPATAGVDEAADRKGSGYQIGVSWTGMQGLYIGFDLQSMTDKEAGGEGSEDQVKSAMGLRVDFSGAQLGYWSNKVTDVGGTLDAELTQTWIKLAYFIKVSDNASIVPEYTTFTSQAGEDADAITNTLIRLVGNVTF